MEERIQNEIALLKRLYPDIKCGEKLDWVLIPQLVLPTERFNKPTTRILFRIPAGYPQVGPDNFFVDLDLRLKDGSCPPAFNANSQSSSGAAPISGDWGWFSWHPNAWRPAATIDGGDNLTGFVRTINLCLRGEESA